MSTAIQAETVYLFKKLNDVLIILLTIRNSLNSPLWRYSRYAIKLIKYSYLAINHRRDQSWISWALKAQRRTRLSRSIKTIERHLTASSFTSCLIQAVINWSLCKSVPELGCSCFIFHSFPSVPPPTPHFPCLVRVCAFVAARMPMPSSKDMSKPRLWQRLLSGSQTRTHINKHTHTHRSNHAFISRPDNAHWLQHISAGITKVTSGSQGYHQSRSQKCRKKGCGWSLVRWHSHIHGKNPTQK